MEYKISGLNWLCVRDTDGNWIPAFKLTQDQISALKEAAQEVEQKKGLYLNETLLTHKDGFNNFTRTLKDRCEPTCGVVLRNGKRVEVAYSHHQQSFHTTDWNYSWRLDGSSLKNSDLDIVSM
jgi:hypothetical protein